MQNSNTKSNYLVAEIHHFKFEQDHNTFFKDISLDLLGKDFNFLIGISGIGKTTLLKIILGSFSGVKSKVEFVYQDKTYNCNEAKKMGLIGYASQMPLLVPWENIKSNLELPFRLNKNLKMPSLTEMRNELFLVGLTESKVLDKFPDELSFGMRARISLIRTLLYRPKFIFLDELFTGIDTINSNLIAEKLKTYLRDNNAVCLSITHDIDRAVNNANNIYLLNRSQSLVKLNKPFTSNNIIEIINNN